MPALPGDSSDARQRRGRFDRLGRSRGLGASLLLHGAALAVLALTTLPLPPRPLDFWLLAEASGKDVPAVAELDLQPVELNEDAEQLSAPVDELLDSGAASLGELTAVAAVGEFGAPHGPLSGMLTDVGAMFGDQGSGLAELGGGLGAAPAARFFGARIEGRRIVFVLDNSGSMSGGRLETVIDELKRSVDALTSEQEFYVLFYSDAVYGLFYPHPVQRYVEPTDKNKQRLAAWLDSVELCLGGAIDEAVMAAESIEPDTVFLLSDGVIMSQRKKQYVLDGRRRHFPIHTVAVGLGNASKGRANLMAIAEANHGEFREAEAPASMRDLARERPRPYHNKEPGAVWGRSVRLPKAWGRPRTQ